MGLSSTRRICFCHRGPNVNLESALVPVRGRLCCYLHYHHHQYYHYYYYYYHCYYTN